ncbi:MAG: GGDEF domain-containing protein [Desulfovibrionaceae bacterium]|nr:GGDEF domain-containing protein [Desulfovibrionaceae bacterium]
MKKSSYEIFKKAVPLFLIILAAIGVFLGGSAAFFYFSGHNEFIAGLEAGESRIVEREATAIRHEFDNVIDDIRFLAGLNELRLFLDTGDPHLLKGVQNEFMHMANLKQKYDQIRCLDETGMEVVRINNLDGRAVAVPEDRLQNKGRRYYFISAIDLDEGHIYMSPMDLNVEHDIIETPLKPVIRFALPLFDSVGHKKGIVMINYNASGMLDRIATSGENSLGDVALLNHHGYWLLGPEKDREWGFMYPGLGQETFSRDFPKEWKRLRESSMSQFTSKNGLYTAAVINPITEDRISRYSIAPGHISAEVEPSLFFWVLVSHVPGKIIKADTRKLIFEILAGSSALLIFMLGGGAHLAVAITRRREYQAQLVEWALYDTLTGLANRKLFFDRLCAGMSMAKRHKRRLALLYIDLDGFKAVNDTYGHEAGDALLVQVGKRLTGMVRQSDTVARLGGDEFAVILAEIEHTGAASGVGRKIVGELSRPFKLERATVTIGASIGVAVYPDHATSEDALVQGADEAMYVSKEKGKNRCTSADQVKS